MHVDEHTIELDSSPVFYRSAEIDGTPPLYLHGIPNSADDWESLLARTGGIAPDLIGFGRSTKAGHLDYSIAGLADWVQSLLATLGIDRVKLVGHDWGAAVALELAAREPERVERMVLCQAPPLIEGFRWPRPARLCRRPVVGELVMGATNRWLLKRMLRHGSVNPGAWTEARAKTAWAQFDQGTQRAILRLHRQTPPAWLATRLAEVQRLTAPVLIVWGDRDPWSDPALAEAYARRLPKATIELVPGAGHWPWLERPEVEDRIAGFLAQEQP